MANKDSIDLEVIEAFGHRFRIEKARGFEIVICLDDGFINYSKLCESITGVKQKFKDICKDNSSIIDLIYAFEPHKLSKIASGGFPSDENIDEILTKIKKEKFDVNKFRELGIFKVFTGGDNPSLRGTYGPR